MKDFLLGGAAGGRQYSGLFPVSYTHLDVYKRQVIILLGGQFGGLDGAFLHKLRHRGKTDAVTVMGFLLAATIYHNNIRNG